MFIGAHTVISSRDPEADRAFLRDVLGLPHVDAGGGWLIFGLPPGEVAVHPSGRNDVHEFFLMCEDVDGFVAGMAARGVACASIESPPWGRLTRLTLPGGGRIGVYQPRHARPKSARAKAPRRSGTKPSPRTPSRAKAKARPGARRRPPASPRGRSARRR